MPALSLLEGHYLLMSGVKFFRTAIMSAAGLIFDKLASDRSMDPLNDRLLDPPHRSGAGVVGM